MNKAILAAATALSMAAMPAVAQGQDGATMYPAEHQQIIETMDDNQRVIFDSWDAERQAAYFGWDDTTRNYYWTLDSDQQNAWWYLDDQQRLSLVMIESPDQRDAIWTAIIAQVNELEPTPSATTTAATTTSADVNFVSNEMVQNVPMPSTPKEYPVCESDDDDSCINAWAAGQRGPGVSRPLDYWPEQPASDAGSDD